MHIMYDIPNRERAVVGTPGVARTVAPPAR